MSNVQEALKAIIYDLENDRVINRRHLLARLKSIEIEKCEPVAYNHHFIYDDDFMPEEVLSHSKEIPAVSGMKYAGKTDILYTSPQPRDWVQLTDEQAYKCISDNATNSQLDLVRDVEAKLKQLNTKG